MKKIKSQAAKFLTENGFLQMAKDVKKSNDIKEIIANLESAVIVICNSTNNPKKEQLKNALNLFKAHASLI